MFILCTYLTLTILVKLSLIALQAHMTIVESFIFLGFVNATNSGVAEAGGQVAYANPDFGRIEGAARQRRGAALLLAHSDFQTLRHLWIHLRLI